MVVTSEALKKEASYLVHRLICTSASAPWSIIICIFRGYVASKFWEITYNVSETVQDSDIVTIEDW